jgi:hypothetical protein
MSAAVSKPERPHGGMAVDSRRSVTSEDYDPTKIRLSDSAHLKGWDSSLHLSDADVRRRPARRRAGGARWRPSPGRLDGPVPPTEIQKDYPTEASPSPTRIGLAEDSTRTLQGYLSSRWRDSPALFPSRSSDRISSRAVRTVVEDVAEAAEVRPYRLDGFTRPALGRVAARSPSLRRLADAPR